MQGKPNPRRTRYVGPNGRAERNVYTRTNAAGQTVFEIGYRDSDGRQTWEPVPGGGTITTARALRDDRLGAKARGERVARAVKLTFGDAAAQWRASQLVSLRPSTRAVYEMSLDVHVLPAWGRKQLDAITVNEVAQLVERMSTAEYRREIDNRLGRKPRNARTYSASSISAALLPASRVFDFARRRLGWTGENPARLLERSERPHAAPRERRILTGDETTRLLAAVEDRYRPVFIFAAQTGARLGEVLGLKWRMIDFAAGTVSLTHQADRKGRYVELKTRRSRRTIELPLPLAALLRRHRLASRYSGPDQYVFASRVGRPLEHRNIGGRVMARAVKATGLDRGEQRAPTFHSLRHGFASAWIAAGGDLVELSAILGHRDPSITARVYAQEFEKASRSDARRERIEGMFGPALGSVMEATGHRGPLQPATDDGGNVALIAATRG
jgi:integrase